MAVIDNINPLIGIAAVTGLLSIYYLLMLLVQLRKISMVGVIGRGFGFLFLGLTSAFISILVIGIQGYQGLTHEAKAADIELNRIDKQSFHARLTFEDGSDQVFVLKGDEIQVDAYVLKWKPWANILGLKTAYRLDRVSGRYRAIEEEKQKERTVFAVTNKASRGLVEWREEYQFLSFLLDVEHGSASFVSVENSSRYQLMVTNSGLLIRPAG